MTSPIAEVAQLLTSMPDTASYEDIQYHVYVLAKIRRGAERADLEGTVSQEQAMQRLSRWLVS